MAIANRIPQLNSEWERSWPFSGKIQDIETLGGWWLSHGILGNLGHGRGSAAVAATMQSRLLPSKYVIWVESWVIQA
jgi:hypothetical protein